MKRLLLGLVALLLAIAPAVAYDPVAKYYATPPTWNDGDSTALLTDQNGRLVILQTPSALASYGITSVVSTAAESSHVLKASGGNLYSVYVTSGATAGYLLVFNAISAPGNGAVTPVHCTVVPANATVGISYPVAPAAFSTGITAVFSSTGCFTLTASATAFFNGSVK